MQSEHSKTKIKQCTFLCYNSILHGLTVKGTQVAMKKLPYFILFSTLVACGTRPTTDDCKNSKIKEDTITMDSVLTDPNGLPFWTADTIRDTNLPMVLLMDSLYRFVKSDEFRSNNLNENISWMSNYRNQLCAYYDRNKMGIDTVSSFSKADTVIKYANQLWELDDDYSTVGMIINNDTKRTRNVFTHYNELINLLDLCNSEKKRSALKAEFETWNRLENKINNIITNLIALKYCGGSGENPARTSAYLKILDAHIQLYEKETNWVRRFGDFGTKGVYPQLAKELLIECCQNAYNENYDSDYARSHDYYKQTAKDAKQSISQLSVTIDKWLETRKCWVDINGSDWSEELYNLNTGEVLLDLSNIICL